MIAVEEGFSSRRALLKSIIARCLPEDFVRAGGARLLHSRVNALAVRRYASTGENHGSTNL